MDYPKLAGKLKGEGYVLLDHLVTGLEGDTYDGRSKAAREFIRGLRPGPVRCAPIPATAAETSVPLPESRGRATPRPR